MYFFQQINYYYLINEHITYVTETERFDYLREKRDATIIQPKVA